MPIDPIAAGVIANAAFQILTTSAKVTASALKAKLTGWALSNSTLQELEAQFDRLGVDDEMSPKAIERAISASPELVDLLKNVKPGTSTVINQTINGDGTNTNIGIQIKQ